jgi:hypothetical protein
LPSARREDFTEPGHPEKEIAMFGRRRKSDKLPAELMLTAATSSISIGPSALAQLHSRTHGITPAHKALLASSLASRPVEGSIVLAQAMSHPSTRRESPQGAAPLSEVVLTDAQRRLGRTLEDHLDAAASDAGLTIEKLASVFQSQGWPYETRGDVLLTVAEGLPLVFTIDAENGILHVFLPVAPGRGQQGYVTVRPEAEMSAAVYMLTSNYRLPYGGFTRDHRDGEIRFEGSLLVADATLTAEQVAGMMVFAIASLSIHGPIIFGLLRGEISLKQALARLDAQSRPPDVMIA